MTVRVPLVLSASSAAATVTFWFTVPLAGVKVSAPVVTLMSVSPELPPRR